MYTSRSLFVFDHINHSIVGSKTSIKKASKFNSPEYKELAKLMAEHPDYCIMEKEIHTNSSKRTYHGLTIKLMEDFISVQDNAEEMLSKFRTALSSSEAQGRKYTLTKKWFLRTYPGFDVAEAKKQIDAAIIASFNEDAALAG